MDRAERIEKLIAEMSVEEKALLTSGEKFWFVRGIKKRGIQKYMVSDGPHGLRKQSETADNLGINESVKATCFPTAVTVASSWNRDLLSGMGKNIGEEAKEERLGIVLGPGINIKRSPLCGRNFEYFSEDPYLTGQCAKQYINGIQNEGIGTSLKHFAVNNQEGDRMRVSAVVDERALREIYLSAFETAVKEAQPYTLMCSYNRINGTYASQNKKILTDILRDEWGFHGYVMTDWGAIDDRIESLKAGLDLEMPGGVAKTVKNIVEAVESGKLDIEVLNTTVRRLLNIQFRIEENRAEGFKYDKEAHHKFARKAATEGAVLMKNDNGILPLDEEKVPLTIIGSLFRHPRYQGSGSSQINPHKVISPAVALEERGVDYRYAKGYSHIDDKPDKAMIKEAVELVRNANGPVLVFLGLTMFYESEGYDRTHMRIPTNQLALMEELTKLDKDLVVVLYGGSPVEMPWANGVKSILNMYLPGQAGGEAVWDLIFGDVNPSGKLAETYPNALEENPSAKHFPEGPKTVEYRESIYVGYRYYDKAGKDVAYPFGHGLSYTEFQYSDLRTDREFRENGETVTVTCTVENVGEREGKEVVQLYVGLPNAKVFRPVRELKGFEKVFLKPGERKEVSFTLDDRSFAYYNVAISDWAIESGNYEISVGASSRDLRLTGTLQVNAPEVPLPYDVEKAAEYYRPGLEISDEAFTALYGQELPSKEFSIKPVGWDNNVTEAAKVNWFGKVMKFGMKLGGKFSVRGKDENAQMMREFMSFTMLNTPFRSMATTNGGILSMDAMKGMLKMMNHKFFSGVGQLLRGLSENGKYAKHLKKLQEED